jgi:hypothetical protein
MNKLLLNKNFTSAVINAIGIDHITGATINPIIAKSGPKKRHICILKKKEVLFVKNLTSSPNDLFYAIGPSTYFKKD